MSEPILTGSEFPVYDPFSGRRFYGRNHNISITPERRIIHLKSYSCSDLEHLICFSFQKRQNALGLTMLSVRAMMYERRPSLQRILM